MYLSHFGLRHYPFKKDLKPCDFFGSSAQDEAQSRMAHLIEMQGIGLLTGEPGTGKTAVCRRIVNNVHEGLYQVRYVAFSTGTVRDVYNVISEAFGLEQWQTRGHLWIQLRAEITRLKSESRKLPVLIFDEAHLLHNDVLADLKLLTNFDMDSDDQLCLLLVGLTELRERLKMSIHESLAQRIVVNYHLQAFTRDEVGSYINHRLRIAGTKLELFSKTAVEAVAASANKIPRRIDQIAHHALIAAAADVSQLVNENHVIQAIEDTKL